MRFIGILISLSFAMAGVAMGQGVITTVAGAPFTSCGALGDGGPGTSAQLCGAQSTAVDASGNIYFYDYGNARIRQITPSGIINTIAGNGVHGTSGDGGPALSANLGSIFQLAVDPSGQRLCFGDSSASKIRCVFLATGTIQGYGTGAYGYGGLGDGGDVANATFNDPVGVAFDDAGNLYVSDFSDMRVRRVDVGTSIITTYAGPGPGYCCAPLGDGGAAARANLYEPRGLFYRNGALYIADSGNDRVRRVDSATGIITTVAGNGNPYDSGNTDGGPALAAGIVPAWIALDTSGNLFIEVGTAVRMVDTSGIITTIAGSLGTDGYGYDDVPATETLFAGISGLGYDPIAKRLLITDNGSRIRQIFFTPPTTTALNVSPNPAYPGQQVILQAAVSPGDATGSMRFYQGGSLLGSSPLSNGVATFNWAAGAVNVYSTHAVYGGDPTHNLSISNSVMLNVQRSHTTTALTSSLNPSTFGSAITLTAAVSPSTATGTVQFFNGGILLGSTNLASGKAQLLIATLPAGSDSLTANYGGDGSNAGSISGVLLQTVNKSKSTTTISANPPSQATSGQTVTFTAKVTPSLATGIVQFADGSAVLGSATLTSGMATFSTSSLAVGNHSIKASYGGNSNVNSSSSASLSYKVKR
jgi:large repetitive protein